MPFSSEPALASRARAPRWSAHRLITSSVAALALLVPMLVPSSASADTAPQPPVTVPTVSADALPTVQIGQGVVWDQVIVGNTVYVTGEFTTARPSGVAAGGTGQVSRTNLLAYNLTTGVLSTSWTPTLDGAGKSIKASADGKTIYVGGSFTHVNGTLRNRLAAIDASTGALVSAFNPNPNARVNVIGLSGSLVYAGGIFTTMGGQARARLAAVNATTGAVQAWAPSADAEVMSLTAPAGGTEVVVGGHFNNLNTTGASGLGAISTADGSVIPFAINTIIQNGGNDAGVTSLTSDGTRVYGTGYTFGPGNFEGTFAATIDGGNEVFITGCRGDTYDASVTGSVLYSVSHSHDCSAIGGNPTTDPWTYQHAWAQTTTAASSGLTNVGSPFGQYFVGQPAPELLAWLPTLTNGTYTGKSQAAWTVESNSQYVVMGGEFPTVNGAAQQGLTRFAVSSLAPNTQGPQTVVTPTAQTPTLVGLSPGRVRVSWTTAWDRDNRNLTYQVLRGATLASATVISTQTQDSAWYNRPAMFFQDATAPVGSTQTYRIRVKDAFNNNLTSNTATIQIPAGNGTSSVYANAVTGDGATHLWRLGEGSGIKAYDYVAADDLAVDSSATRGAPGAMVNDSSALSTTFDGSANVPSVSPSLITGPQTFSEEGWFKTTSSTGGKIVGFGNNNNGDSSGYDRHVYMTNDGKITFGVYPGGVRAIASAKSYNDGQWHQFVANLGSGGQELYLDGSLVGSDAGTTSAQPYSGYWRIGGDNLGGWPNQPSSNKFIGSIEDVAIYPAPLAKAQVQAHYGASGRAFTGPVRPTDAYGASVWDANPTFYWRLDDAVGSTTAMDRITNTATGAYSGGVVQGEAGAPANATGTSIRLPGDSTQAVVSSVAVNNPTVYTEETWFKTTSTSGGRLIGFGNSNDPNGTSGSFDRYIWMLNDGTLRYGIYTGDTVTVASPNSYNDGQWHLAAATQDSSGMKLYVDGLLVGTDPASAPQNYAGYWRLGTDNVWFGASTNNFAGSLDEAAVYDRALPAATIAQHYQLGKPASANQAPTAAFTSTTADLKATFDGSTSADTDGTVASYGWQFGDGTTGTGVSPAHTYATAGTYTVALTVTDDKGATGTVSHPVAVTQAANVLPTAAFTSSTTKLKASFDGSSSVDSDGTIQSYAWDFGDGASGSGVSPTHTYAASGSYTVALTVTDDRSGSNTITHPVSVTANVAPNAAFTNACTNLACSFDATGATGSTDPDGTIAAYAWDFGDGATSTVSKPVHTFATAGSYAVKLVVTDNDGATGDTVVPISVSAANVSPTASLVSSCSSLDCTFDGSASSDPDGTIATYAWDFGDGATSTVAKPSHSFAAAGAQTVTLTVTDNRGGTGTTNKTLTVTAPNKKPIAVFSKACTGLGCTFNASASHDDDGSIVSYGWDFGDGTTGTGSTASHTYAQGSYTVTLTVTDDGGATGTATDTVSPAPVPNQAPTAAFTFTKTDLTASFDGTPSSDPDGSVIGWSWNFGDGSPVVSGTNATPAHTYASGGTYQVSLTVTDNGGTTNNVTKPVSVTAPATNQPPLASFSSSCTNLACALDGSGSTDDGTIASYSWNFGDGTAAGVGAKPSHTFAASGTYSVTLTVTDNGGLANAITRGVSVTAAPATLATDAFGRTVASGFATADTGGAWTYSGAKTSASVADGSGRFSVPLGATGYERLGGVQNLSTDLTHTVWTEALPTGGGAYLASIVRSTASGDYFAQVRIQSSGVVQLYMSKTGTALGTTVTVPGLTYTAGTKLKVRVQAIGSAPTTLRAKVWLASGTEPASWQVSTTDSSPGYQVAGGVGVSPYLSGSATATLIVRYDDVTVTSTN